MATDVRNLEEKLDENLLAALPDGGKVVSVTPSGMSDYCNTFRIEVSMPDGSTQVYFEKEASGQEGLELMESAWTSENTTYEFIPEHVPRPVKKGSYKSRPDRHFFLAEFKEMIEDDIPRPESYMAAIAALHSRSMGKSPDGKFGFPVNTRFGNLEQDNSWTGTWEEYWTRQMKDFLQREDAAHAGEHHAELERLRPLFFEKVLPRFLRPLESDGRSVTPCLIHADLWPGNVKYQTDGETVCVYDACAMWGHNEVDLGVFRNPRYPLGKPYLKEYWKHVPISEPEEDVDSRNTLYMLRNQILLSTLYPHDPKLREIVVNNMELLVDKVEAEEAEKTKPQTGTYHAHL
ncbi:Fructosamine kinase-domain-containing protein [Triangularia verruculosa]|uniref:protein-ribulosamine 3-kinase n=1 Tax=Triangularia verruculosa TaxID=2587418 RepID=A0AAN6XHL8_9PEZI|nr:Fructosamine kinase-domain-containing protein [Triangularia verruculosa]